jgi:N-methylhydantoinase A/oxoprolinase/acetone carboxylase beta subunit
VTDANVLLGHMDAAGSLPGGIDLDHGAAERAVGRLAESLGLQLADAAHGIVRVANAEMAGAVRVMTVERGLDPRDLALLAFGGAGPMHACGVAEELGMSRVVVPAASGVLSALGMVVSERRVDAVESVLLAGAGITAEAVSEVVSRLAAVAEAQLGQSGEVRASFDLRYAGQAFELTVQKEEVVSVRELRDGFERAHEERYGYADPDAEIELVTMRVAVVLPGAASPSRTGEADRRETGPSVVPLAEATLVIADGWTGSRDATGTWTLERAG